MGIWKTQAPKHLAQGHSVDWLRASFPLTPEIHRVMKAWGNSPHTVAIGDFEYLPQYQTILKHQSIMEFSLANAEGEWIVRKTPINHEMSIGECAALLCSVYDQQQGTGSKVQRPDFGMTMAVSRKAYGPEGSLGQKLPM